MPRPDAVIVPNSFQLGGSDAAKKESVLDVAEPLLELGPLELCWCRHQVSYHYCTRDNTDTEFYATGHPLEKQPRYRWEARPDGVKLGYLIDGPQAH